MFYAVVWLSYLLCEDKFVDIVFEVQITITKIIIFVTFAANNDN